MIQIFQFQCKGKMFRVFPSGVKNGIMESEASHWTSLDRLRQPKLVQWTNLEYFRLTRGGIGIAYSDAYKANKTTVCLVWEKIFPVLHKSINYGLSKYRNKRVNPKFCVNYK